MERARSQILTWVEEGMLPPARLGDALRAAGKKQQADMLASMTLTPQAGVDFTALRNTLLFVAVIYILSSLFSWAQAYIMAGVTQRTLDTRALICGVDVDWSAGPAAAAVELRDRGERPVAMPASPLMHSTAFTFASLPALTAGGAIVTLERRASAGAVGH